jgi:ABC-2 type transport system ATP-binding protein
MSNVTYSYSEKVPALSNVNLEITIPKIHILLGPNGSGKTTLIKLIFDLLAIQKEGKITINGHDNKDIFAKKSMMYLPSDNLLPEFLTGLEFVYFISKLYDYSIDNRKLDKLLEYYELKDKSNMLIESYSHGMKKKIQLVVAFLIQPKLIVLDETLNGIDLLAKEVSNVLMNKVVDNGSAVLLATHEIDYAQKNRGLSYCVAQWRSRC